MSKNSLVGHNGYEHKSAAEARASFILAKHGWVAYEDRFPVQFTDSEGTKFYACPDFYHPKTGFYAEFKTRRMNGVGTKTKADRYIAELEVQVARGFIAKKHEMFKRLEKAWNHSIQKVAAVASQLCGTTPFLLIYENEQDLNEERRCARNGIFMLSLANISGFHLFLKMASVGCAVGFERNGFRFSTIK